MGDLALTGDRVLAGRRIAVPAAADLDNVARLIGEYGAEVSRFEIGTSAGAHSLESWIFGLIEGDFDDVVFLSAQGVRLLVEVSRQLGKEDEVVTALARTRKIVAGPKPDAALGEVGLSADVSAARSGVDALVPVLSQLDFDAHVVGLASLSADVQLVRLLEEKGASIRRLSSEGTLGSGADELVQRLVQAALDVVVFNSPLQLEATFEAARRAGLGNQIVHALEAIDVVTVGTSVELALKRKGVRAGRTISRRALGRERSNELIAALAERRESRAPSTSSAPPESPLRPRAQKKRTIVVIGNGMVGHRFCDLLTQYDKSESFEIVVFCEEPRPAYDRVNLTSFFEKKSADDLLLARPEWYKERKIRLLLGERATKLDRERKAIRSSSGEWIYYDVAVLATGSSPFVPPIPGVDKRGVFVYRTIEDLEAIRSFARGVKRAAVLGGGLLGLEAAKAVRDLGLETHVVEFAPRLMPRQLDSASSRLLGRSIEGLGVKVHLGRNTSRIFGRERVEGLAFSEGEPVAVDMVVVSAGIRPRDELARQAGLEVGERGGVLIDDALATSDPAIFAIGECAQHRSVVYGLVAPGYQMAEALARNLTGGEAKFEGADQSAKLKLLGVDVASLGNPFADAHGARTIVYEDLVKGVYKKLLISADRKRLIGGILVGDVSEYGSLLHVLRSGEQLPDSPEELIFGAREGKGSGGLPDTAQVCSCNNVTKREICGAIRDGACTLVDLKAKTRAGTGCGGCVPLVTDLLAAELQSAGKAVKNQLCEHFAFTRQELYQIVKINRLRTFEELLKSHGAGSGCEVCKPAIASILASVYNEMILRHESLQDTNDRYLANVQRGGLYSVVPRIPAGEITPEKLIKLGEIAKKYQLYTKITGGQRIDLLGARIEQLPEIWEDLVSAGFESGHAYGKAMRTVKSCVGSTWCRFGVQDSVSLAIRIEERYKGIRAPHKMKAAVSGCIRECAEAQSKDFGLIATEKGWNVYVCGNGGAKPKHAVLLIADVDEETAIRYLDRFVMYYIMTADKLTRTSVWLEKLEGGIEYLRDVIINDRLGICEQLERDLEYLVKTYKCEWAEVVKDPVRRARFRHFANSPEPDISVELVEERGQKRPADWIKAPPEPVRDRRHLPLIQTSWVKVGKVSDFPADGGSAIQYGDAQIAVFNFASRGEWYATQNMCPHMRDMVLARGLIGDQQGTPKVACPMHKKTFSLVSGECLSGEAFKVRTFPVKVENGFVYLDLPSVKEVEKLLVVKTPASCRALHGEAQRPAQQTA